MSKVRSLEEMAAEREELRRAGRALVFTNGCFDLLHAGHVDLLRKARARGDLLLVAVNDDDSIRRLKGEGRPILPLDERLEILSAVRFVDRIVVFPEDTPLQVIERLRPDVLVKGADWALDAIVGREEVEASGGKVVRVPLREGISTTDLLRRIRNAD